MPKIKIAPSILSADRNKLQDEVNEIEREADLLHVDIMDGKFVKPVTFQAEEIKKVKSKVPKDVHLMVEHPLEFIDAFADAGASIITIHEEAKDDINETLEKIKSKGIKAAISIKPKTSLIKIKNYLDKVDMVLIMSVEPGYAGQKFMPEVMPKILELRRLEPEMDIEIDGGIGLSNIKIAADAGANVFVAGTSVFKQKDKVKAIQELRKAAQ